VLFDRMIHTLRANSTSFGSCEQHVPRATNVPPSVIML
jgi:hypothetical protein